jgi:hypothetical protein
MSVTPKPTSILELYRQYRTDKLIVNRRYQRKLVWTKLEKAALIESVLLEYPIPLILLAEVESQNNEDDTAYEIIDGMQRLNALFSFIENEFPVNNKYFDISKHPFAKELKDKGMFGNVEEAQIIWESDLLESDKCSKFLEYQLAVTIHRPTKPQEIEDIFNRINSNGKHLSPQEVRQAGVTTKFSELVRVLGSEIRGDVSQETLPLTSMPQISIDAKSTSLGYGVSAEETFWCEQGILRISQIRDSEDEQLLADFILSITLDSPFAASKDNFDAYYGKGDQDKSNEINLAISKYGEECLKSDIKAVLSAIKEVIASVQGDKRDKNFLKKILNPSAGSNPVKEPFYSVFMAFYELMIKESKEPFDYSEIIQSLNELASKIKTSSNVLTENRNHNINLTKGLIQKSFKSSTTPHRSSGSYAIDLENYLKRSKIEAPRYDFKQGFYDLSGQRNFDDRFFESFLQNIAAMANLGRNRKGFIFVGISDKEEDSNRIESLDNIQVSRIPPFGIVGLEREARIRGTSLDDYVLFITRKIRESNLPDWLKTEVNSSLNPITYSGKTVLMFEISSGSEPVWYKDKLYIRDGNEKRAQEISGAQVNAVYNLFKEKA